jgi:ribosomal protein L21
VAKVRRAKIVGPEKLTPVALPQVGQTVYVPHPPVAAHHSLLDASKASATEAAPVPLPTQFAVIAIHDRQYKVCEDDLVMIDKIDVAPGKRIVFDRVLLIGSLAETLIGRPNVVGATVHATVEEQAQTAKIMS